MLTISVVTVNFQVHSNFLQSVTYDHKCTPFQVKIREIPIKEKLEYLYCLLSSVLPVAKRIHREQCSEVEFEKKLRGDLLIKFY